MADNRIAALGVQSEGSPAGCAHTLRVHAWRVSSIALSIAGSDPSGGAGIQADLKTFHAHGVFGMAAVSLLTVQNTHGVRRVQPIAPELLSEQIVALFEDVAPHAIKTGALGGAAQVEAVAAALAGRGVPLVVDPVCVSKTGAALLDEAGRAALLAKLCPIATVITPNLAEAELLLGRKLGDPEDLEEAARALLGFGSRAVLLKGGHRRGDPIDVLCDSGELLLLHGPRVETRHTHGVGCTLSAAVAARLALGHSLREACELAKQWVTAALASAPGIGGGQGALNHGAPLPRR
jgi:hydroxymethylpyrimidine/phosphomethylpyrimidine kinase